ncbi:MAG: hypothetical protein AB7T49_10080 [Oligoflexales bacterium]
MRNIVLLFAFMCLVACNRGSSRPKQKAKSAPKADTFNTQLEDCVAEVDTVEGVSGCLEKVIPEGVPECVRAVDQMKSKREKQTVAELCCRLLDRSLHRECYAKMGL